VRLEVLRRRPELRVASELQAIAEPEAVVEFQTVAVLILLIYFVNWTASSLYH
jgi:hypothetical protein